MAGLKTQMVSRLHLSPKRYLFYQEQLGSVKAVADSVRSVPLMFCFWSE
jgi:hypothetical protein